MKTRVTTVTKPVVEKVVIELSLDDAARLGAFLQASNVGVDRDVWSAVYNPLWEALSTIPSDSGELWRGFEYRDRMPKDKK